MIKKFIICLFVLSFSTSNLFAEEKSFVSKDLNSFSNLEYNDLVEIVANGTINDLNNYILNNKVGNEEGEIAAQVALLLDKNKMLDILASKKFFPCYEPLLTKENITSLKIINLDTVKKEIEDVRYSWGEDGAEGDCASMDPNSVIISSDSEQFEIILKHNKWMCEDKILMCGATTYQLISSEDKKKRAYRRICGN